MKKLASAIVLVLVLGCFDEFKNEDVNDRASRDFLRGQLRSVYREIPIVDWAINCLRVFTDLIALGAELAVR